MKNIKWLILILTVYLTFLYSFKICSATNITAESDVSVTFTPGTLTLVQIPSITFGDNIISANTKLSPAQEASVYLKVIDLRGSGVGWKVVATCSEFTNGVSFTLPRASIIFTNPTVSELFPGILPITVNSPIILEADGISSTNVAIAEANQGLGNNTIEWIGIEGNNENVNLNIIGGTATLGSHYATITWSLIDAP